jgi:hypothetical protein
MGILDDAIREHLELKRRRGTDPTEIERLEREALGPVRRAPQDAADAFPDEEAAPDAYPAEEGVPEWDEPLEEPTAFDPGRDTEDRRDTEDPDATQAWPQPASEFMEPPEDYEDEPSPAPQRPSESPRHHEIAGEWEAHEREKLPAEPAGFEPDAPAPAPPAPTPEGQDLADTPPPASAGGPAFGEERRRSRPPGEIDQETAEYAVEPEAPAGEQPAEGEDVLEETPDFLQDTPDHDRLWFEQRPPRDFDFDG